MSDPLTPITKMLLDDVLRPIPRCGSCKGTGEAHEWNATGDLVRVRPLAMCEACSGTGLVLDKHKSSGRTMTKRVIFELSMPSNNAWNGKWSGEGGDYTVAKRIAVAKFDSLKPRYTYNFGDGWIAAVRVREAAPREKASNRFCGYEWMIDSILKRGAITAE